MKLYTYWRSSSAWRVRIALAYKGIEHDVMPVHLLRDGGEQHHADFLAKNLLGQVPVLELSPPPAPVFLTQSLAIIEYLEELHPEPPLLPSEPLARAAARSLAEIVNSGIQPFQNSGVLRHLERAAPELDRKQWLRHFIGRGLGALERAAEAHSGSFLVGDAPSVADVCLVPQLYSARRFGVTTDVYPTLCRVEVECLRLDAFRDSRPEAQPDAEIVA
ncbi:MAG TPA: maleylacetoacetate isomerase [Polyangiaceae bacterium]